MDNSNLLVRRAADWAQGLRFSATSARRDNERFVGVGPAELEALADRLISDDAEIERLHGCLLWLLWGHQGGSSPVGQPIRRALGIDANASMTPEQIEAGQRFGIGA